MRICSISLAQPFHKLASIVIKNTRVYLLVVLRLRVRPILGTLLVFQRLLPLRLLCPPQPTPLALTIKHQGNKTTKSEKRIVRRYKCVEMCISVETRFLTTALCIIDVGKPVSRPDEKHLTWLKVFFLLLLQELRHSCLPRSFLRRCLRRNETT